MGARVVLIEKGAMGGECLNTGCVPSKALIAAAAAAEGVRRARMFGVAAGEPEVDFAAAMAHVKRVIAEIAPHDSVERFRSLGVRVIEAAARFEGPDSVAAGDVCVQARRFVIATGSRPAIPPIAGLDAIPFLTNETVFELEERPERLVIVGGGPIGCELAQAFRRLGARVRVIEMGAILPREDPALVAAVRQRLLAEGVEVCEQARLVQVDGTAGTINLSVESAGKPLRFEASHLLVATGRLANVEGLGLDAAGVAMAKDGIAVDRRFRTSNKRIFAIGDAIGGQRFTHAASYQAQIVMRNALFALPAKATLAVMPRVTYTDPELAQAGLTEAEAKAQGRADRVLAASFAENDRARAEGRSEGSIKVIVGRGGRVLGASIVGRHAGELILPWAMAIQQGFRIKSLASVVAPYPTLGEISKVAAGRYYAPLLFSKRVRSVVRLLQKLP